MLYMCKHLFISNTPIIYMFRIVEDKLDEVNKNLIKTNELLAKIEENLRVPNMVEWAKFREELIKINSD